MQNKPVRKHSDTAIQAEVNNLYSLINSKKNILIGEASFSNDGTTIQIPKQQSTEYFVGVTPHQQSSFYITKSSDSFCVNSLDNGDFSWIIVY